MKTDTPDSSISIPASAGKLRANKAVWLKTLHQWHWISSAICLLGILLFSITGFTLNHATQIEAKPNVINRKAVLPASLLGELREFAKKEDATLPLPASVTEWLHDNMQANTDKRSVEWSADEAYISLPKPGGDAWVRIGLANGEAEYELTDRGWISWLNDLHKGRHTGVIWSWFIDIFAFGCVLFSLTGLLILKYHAANRPFTWPMVGLGIIVPLLIALLFIH